MSRLIYKNDNPLLSIHLIKTEIARKCLTRNYYRIISRPDKLSRERIISLKKSGFLFSGQMFEILSQCDGKEEPEGYFYLKCVKVDDAGDIIDPKPIDPQTNQPYNLIKLPYYAYDCVDEIDSSD